MKDGKIKLRKDGQPDKRQYNKGQPQALLKPWKKGESGNPKGRPLAKETLSDQIRAILDADSMIKTPDELRLSNLQAIVTQVTKQAIRGDIRSAEFLFDRVYGKPQVTIEMNQTDDLSRSMLIIEATDTNFEEIDDSTTPGGD